VHVYLQDVSVMVLNATVNNIYFQRKHISEDILRKKCTHIFLKYVSFRGYEINKSDLCLFSLTFDTCNKNIGVRTRM